MSLEALDKAAADEAQADSERTIADVSSRRVYRLSEDAITSIGGMDVAAGVVGCDRGDLRRALDQRGRYLAVQHVLRLGARVRKFNATLSTQLSAALVHPMDMCVFPRVSLTDKERADRCEIALRMLGPIGEQALANALGTEPPVLQAMGSRR